MEPGGKTSATARNASLADLVDRVAVPLGMTGVSITPGIVHIGVGNFHRAHLSGMVHRLMQRGAHDRGIIGAGASWK